MTVCCCERFAGPSFGHCVRHVQAGDEVEALGDLEKKSGFMTFNRSVVNCTKQLTVMGFIFFLMGSGVPIQSLWCVLVSCYYLGDIRVRIDCGVRTVRGTWLPLFMGISLFNSR